MLLILLALCLRKPNGISHLFSIAYAFAGNGCVKIVLDKLLIGLLLAAFAFYLTRLVERYRVNLAYRQNLALQRVEACRALITMLADFHYRYHAWLDELEALLKKLNANTALSVDIEKALMQWNTVHSAITSSASALLPVIPMPLVQKFHEYLEVAGRLPKVLHAGLDALPSGDINAGRPLRADLEKAFSTLQATYAQLLAEGSLATAA
jgi:hypothetical protein